MGSTPLLLVLLALGLSLCLLATAYAVLAIAHHRLAGVAWDRLVGLEDLKLAVRKHMNTRGDDRCFQDDHELYLALPEGDTRPDWEVAVTLENCTRYIECRQQGREYVSPQRRIEELEAEVKDLRHQLTNAYDRIGKQSHIITDLIEKHRAEESHAD